eukprot:g947.t1
MLRRASMGSIDLPTNQETRQKLGNQSGVSGSPSDDKENSVQRSAPSSNTPSLKDASLKDRFLRGRLSLHDTNVPQERESASKKNKRSSKKKGSAKKKQRKSTSSTASGADAKKVKKRKSLSSKARKDNKVSNTENQAKRGNITKARAVSRNKAMKVRTTGTLPSSNDGAQRKNLRRGRSIYEMARKTGKISDANRRAKRREQRMNSIKSATVKTTQERKVVQRTASTLAKPVVSSSNIPSNVPKKIKTNRENTVGDRKKKTMRRRSMYTATEMKSHYQRVSTKRSQNIVRDFSSVTATRTDELSEGDRLFGTEAASDEDFFGKPVSKAQGLVAPLRRRVTTFGTSARFKTHTDKSFSNTSSGAGTISEHESSAQRKLRTKSSIAAYKKRMAKARKRHQEKYDVKSRSAPSAPVPGQPTSRQPTKMGAEKKAPNLPLSSNASVDLRSLTNFLHKKLSPNKKKQSLKTKRRALHSRRRYSISTAELSKEFRNLDLDIQRSKKAQKEKEENVTKTSTKRMRRASLMKRSLAKRENRAGLHQKTNLNNTAISAIPEKREIPGEAYDIGPSPSSFCDQLDSPVKIISPARSTRLALMLNETCLASPDAAGGEEEDDELVKIWSNAEAVKAPEDVNDENTVLRPDDPLANFLKAEDRLGLVSLTSTDFMKTNMGKMTGTTKLETSPTLPTQFTTVLINHDTVIAPIAVRGRAKNYC